MAGQTVKMTVWGEGGMQALTDARRKLDAAKAEAKESPQRSGGSAEVIAAQSEYDATVTREAERAYELEFEALRRRPWREFMAVHAPRKGDENDEALGYNRDTFPDACVIRCLIAVEGEPAFGDSLSAREEWLEEHLRPGDWEQAFETAYQWNMGGSANPFDLGYVPSSAATGK